MILLTEAGAECCLARIRQELRVACHGILGLGLASVHLHYDNAYQDKSVGLLTKVY
jgi:hypothetical protein